MKSIKKYMYGIIGLLAAVLIVSCTKSFDPKIVQQRDFSNKTLAQVYVATVGATRNYVYVDGQPVTGVTLGSGSVFPVGGAYAFAVDPGLRAFTIRDTLRTSTQVPLTFAENLQVGRNYTIFTYDTITSPKQLTVITNITSTSPNTAMIRFGNFVYSRTAVPNVDIYSARRKANVFTNIAVTQVTDFVPQEAGFTDTFFVRSTGSTNNLTVKSGTTQVPVSVIFTPVKERLYTLVFRGRYQTDTISTSQRTLSVFTNQ